MEIGDIMFPSEFALPKWRCSATKAGVSLISFFLETVQSSKTRGHLNFHIEKLEQLIKMLCLQLQMHEIVKNSALNRFVNTLLPVFIASLSVWSYLFQINLTKFLGSSLLENCYCVLENKFSRKQLDTHIR